MSLNNCPHQRRDKLGVSELWLRFLFGGLACGWFECGLDYLRFVDRERNYSMGLRGEGSEGFIVSDFSENFAQVFCFFDCTIV